jgi:hypothetical protein
MHFKFTLYIYIFLCIIIIIEPHIRSVFHHNAAPCIGTTSLRGDTTTYINTPLLLPVLQDRMGVLQWCNNFKQEFIFMLVLRRQRLYE